MDIPDLPIYDGDLWGRFYLDYFEKGTPSYYLRRDDGCLQEISIADYFRSELNDLESRAMERVRGHVLDVGCGVGAGILWLQRQGIAVTGIDISPGAIEVAGKRGAKDARTMSLWDLANVEERFDTVTFMGNNMAIAGSLERTGEMLDILRGVTNEGAVLIGNSVDPTATDEPSHLAYHKWNAERGRYVGQVTIRTEYAGFTEPWFDIVLFEPEVLKSICKDHGWEPREVIDSGGRYFLIADKA